MYRRTALWYGKRLEEYYKDHYIFNDRMVERATSCEPNKLIFNVPYLETRFILTCDDNGVVTAKKYPMERRRSTVDVDGIRSRKSRTRSNIVHQGVIQEVK